MVGVLRSYAAGVVDAEEYAAARQRRALREQRFDQRLGLGAGLAPEDAVAGPDRVRQHAYCAAAERRSISALRLQVMTSSSRWL